MYVATVRHSVADRPLRSRFSWFLHLSFAGTALAFLLAAASARPAHASVRERVARSTEVREGPLAVSVRVGGGWAPLYQAARRGDRWYLEAHEGARYEVRVRNTTGERVGFLIAVDGLNAINGQRTSLTANEPLYVLDPYGSTVVKGWRKDLGNVSRFVFVDEERSYAERTGQANGDLGWVRVLAFREHQEIVRWRDDVGVREQETRRQGVIKGGKQSGESGADSRAMPAPKATADAAPSAPRSIDGLESYRAEPKDESSSPGTGWGKNERDQARWVEFEPEQWAAATIVLRYEYHSALVSLGILPYRNWNPGRLWERENGYYGFAQPPGR